MKINVKNPQKFYKSYYQNYEFSFLTTINKLITFSLCNYKKLTKYEINLLQQKISIQNLQNILFTITKFNISLEK